MEAGVSTACFYPMETKDAFILLAKNGVKHIEVFFNTISELEDDYLAELDAVRKEYGVNVVSVHPFTCPMEPLLLFSEYTKRFDDGIKFYGLYFKAAQKLGAKIFVLHGDFKEHAFPNPAGYMRIQKLAECAAEFGVQVAHENVVRCKSSDPKYLLELKEFCPSMKFVLDVKQAVRSGEDPLMFVKLLGSSIIHVHISDNKKGSACLPIGQGTMNLGGFVSDLGGTGFSGTLLLELYRDNFKNERDVLESYYQIQKIIRANKKLF